MTDRPALTDLVQEAHRNAVHKGFWGTRAGTGGVDTSPENIAVKLALVHSEVSEALEVIRKPEGRKEDLIEELADIVIRVFDLAGAVTDPLTFVKSMERKMILNRSRPAKNGKKF